MSFRANDYQQLSLNDKLMNLTERETKALDKSWAKIFADEIVENLMMDLHLQYALHTTIYEEQPISDKTLSRFRKRCYDYETLHGVDLYHDCVKDLSHKIAT